jgi:hypothetical protein
MKESLVAIHRALSSSSSSCSSSVFGTASSMDHIILGWAFVIIVCVVVMLERIIVMIKRSLEESSSIADLVEAVMSELMIVGIMTFTLKEFMDSTTIIPTEWTHAFHFAELTVSVTVFAHCFIMTFLILQVKKNIAVWGRIHSTSLTNILHNFASHAHALHIWYEIF